MSDVLFDFDRHTLRPAAREKLLRFTEVIRAHPGLEVSIEGHTDSVGSEEYNQGLSERRAASVRSFVVQSGVSPSVITSVGMGEGHPVAQPTDQAVSRTAEELVVTGEVTQSAQPCPSETRGL
jgi:outer membrane protein OmpA-like peptidoglycan-associated protein